MGTYYRIVFNSAATSNTQGNNHPSWTLNLSWGNDGTNPDIPFNNPSISTDQSSSNQTNLGKVYVYQYTDDESLNGAKFAYTPTNDVTINGQTFASGLHIQGQYVYDKGYLDGNKETTTTTGTSTNRIWTSDGKVVIDTNWYNKPQFEIATSGALNPTQNTSTNFDISVNYEKNDLLTYTWASDQELANQIKDIFAHYVNTNLSDEVTGSTADKVYLKTDQETGEKATSDVTVTHTDSVLDGGRIQRVYHIKLSNPDIRLKGIISPLTVTANDFTMPTDITSYQDDLDHAIRQGNYGNGISYQSAQTSNQALQDALINTGVPFDSVQNNTTQKAILTNMGSPWGAQISYIGSGNVNNSADPSNTRTASLTFVNYNDPEHPIDLNVTNTVQAAANSKIDFTQATQTLANLEKQGYSLIKVVDDQTGQELKPGDGISLTDLNAYNYGNLIDGPNKFTVYLHWTDIQSISVSESVSVSEQTSSSERLSNSVSLSESLSEVVSQSERLSNSVSMSESLSNSVSMSESLSNVESNSASGSQSGRINSLSDSTSLSESEDIPMPHSKTTEESNSVSMSDSTSLSGSENSSIIDSVMSSHSTSLTETTHPHESVAEDEPTTTVRPKRRIANSVEKPRQQGRLPQTGAKNSNTGLLGLLGATLGLLGLRRRRDRKRK